MSTTPQAFYLRLNNHQGFMTGALAELYANESMVDVTLTAEGQTIRAHRIVLSACSPYFKNILLQFHNGSSQYPIIIIKDIPFADLKAIVEFIYRGEITVPHQQLESILTNGAALQVKGLAEVNRKSVIDADLDSNASKESDERTSIRRYSSEISNHNDNSHSNNNHNRNKNNGRKLALKRSTASRSSINSGTSNGEFGANCGDISSLDDSNQSADGVAVKGANRKQTLPMTGGQTVANQEEIESRVSHTIPSFRANDGKIVKVKTGDQENIVPFNLLEQSMMIDVKQEVNINAAGDRVESSSATDAGQLSHIDLDEEDVMANHNDEDGEDEEEEDNERQKDERRHRDHHQDLIDNMPLALIRSRSVAMKRSAKTKPLTASAAIVAAPSQPSKPAKLRISKAGIPRKGTSLRSQKKYKCPVCFKIYVSPQNMKEHLRNTHTNPNEKYVCALCRKEYSWKHALDRHFKSKHRYTETNNSLK